MDFASNVIYTARGTPILFGQTPHTSSAYDQILEWLGPTGRIVDLRTDKERRAKAGWFQYHHDIDPGHYLHYPITDRAVPTKKQRQAFPALLATMTEGRWYVHCHGVHGRSGLVVACLLVQQGYCASCALTIVHAAHQARPMGAPQKAFVRAFEHDCGGPFQLTGPVLFSEPTGMFGYLSTRWGGAGSSQRRELGGDTHLERLVTPLAPSIRWKTIEHFFQASKFLLQGSPPLPGESPEEFHAFCVAGLEYAVLLAEADTGASVFRLGSLGHPTKHKWHGATGRLHSTVAGKPNTSPLLNDLVRTFVARVRIRSDWEECKEQVMYTALCAKFSQPALLQQLQATGTRPICEHTKRDLFWGDGMDDVNGVNTLGQMLCHIRTMSSPATQGEC